MTNFRLATFPNVCRLCLKPDPTRKMIAISTEDPDLDGTIEDFLSSITFTIAEKNRHFLPQMICVQCLTTLKSYAKYRSLVLDTHLLMNSLAELKHCNFVPIRDLFHNKRESLQVLFKELELCDNLNAEADDLIEEFPLYELASMLDTWNVVIKEEVVEVEPEILDIVVEFNLEVGTEDILPRSPSTEETKTIENVTCPAKKRKQLQSTKNQKLAEPFRCKKCPFETYYPRSVCTHQMSHLKKETKRYLCKEPECSAVFVLKKEFDSHRNINHKSFVCETCGLKCSTKDKLKYHMDRHANEGRYPCEYCQKIFNSEPDRRVHFRQIHLNETAYKCETCGMQFKRGDLLRSHVQRHGDKFDFPCKQCDKQFKTRGSLKKHVGKLHTEASFICDHCDKRYYEKFKLDDHIENNHGIQLRFICDICVQTLRSQTELDAHKMRHDSPKPLECNLCLILFRTPEEYDDHLCITYREDYFCCERDLRHHSMYNKHMFLKHGQKTNVRVKPVPGLLLGQMRARRIRVESCPHCETVFPTRTLKKQHMEICEAKI